MDVLKILFGSVICSAILVIFCFIGLIPVKTERVEINYPAHVVKAYMSFSASPHRRIVNVYIPATTIKATITRKTLLFGETNRELEIQKAIKNYEQEQCE